MVQKNPSSFTSDPVILQSMQAKFLKFLPHNLVVIYFKTLWLEIFLKKIKSNFASLH